SEGEVVDADLHRLRRLRRPQTTSEPPKNGVPAGRQSQPASQPGAGVSAGLHAQVDQGLVPPRRGTGLGQSQFGQLFGEESAGASWVGAEKPPDGAMYCQWRTTPGQVVNGALIAAVDLPGDVPADGAFFPVACAVQFHI